MKSPAPKIDDEVLLSYLKELAERLEILIREEKINLEESFSAGGLCRVEGNCILLLNASDLPPEN